MMSLCGARRGARVVGRARGGVQAGCRTADACWNFGAQRVRRDFWRSARQAQRLLHTLRLECCAPSAAAESWRPTYIPIRSDVVKEFSPFDLSARLHSCNTGRVAGTPSWGVRGKGWACTRVEDKVGAGVGAPIKSTCLVDN